MIIHVLALAAPDGFTIQVSHRKNMLKTKKTVFFHQGISEAKEIWHATLRTSTRPEPEFHLLPWRPWAPTNCRWALVFSCEQCHNLRRHVSVTVTFISFMF